MGMLIRGPFTLIFPISVLFTTHCARSQTESPFFEYGLNVGRMVYQGDLTPSSIGSYRSSRTSFGLSFAKVLGHSISVRAMFIHGGLAGNDALYSQPEYRKQRAFQFRSPVNELTGQISWSYPGVARYEKGFTPYVFAGAGAALLNVTPDATAFNAEFFGTEATQIQEGLAADAAKGPPAVIPVAMAGVGFKYFFTPNWGVTAETAYRLTFSDMVDGFSQSVNPDLKDHFLHHSIGVVYRSGRKRGGSVECPPGGK